jgi:CxC1 like cysteine cluster associated with KDZ transposases
VQQEPGEEPNIALIHEGLLGCSPTQPTVAFSLDTLEIHHQIRRRQASFSVQGMVKVLCAIHNVWKHLLSFIALQVITYIG